MILSLQERLVLFLRKNPGTWYAKGELARMAYDKMGVTGESVGRRLRVLAEVKDMHPNVAANTSPEHEKALQLLDGGVVEVKYGEKNHAWYRYIPPATRQVRRMEMVDGVMKEIYENVATSV
jgi:hypothetical protein